MGNPGVMFDGSSANKIAEMVRKFRQYYQSEIGKGFTGNIRSAFWARINGKTRGDNGWEHTAVQVKKKELGQTWNEWADSDTNTFRRATGLAANGVALYTTGDVPLANDSVVLVFEVVFIDPDDPTFLTEVTEWWTIAAGTAVVILKIISAAAGRGIWNAQPQQIISGVDILAARNLDTTPIYENATDPVTLVTVPTVLVLNRGEMNADTAQSVPLVAGQYVEAKFLQTNSASVDVYETYGVSWSCS